LGCKRFLVLGSGVEVEVVERAGSRGAFACGIREGLLLAEGGARRTEGPSKEEGGRVEWAVLEPAAGR
jgi:hypothetical protein